MLNNHPLSTLKIMVARRLHRACHDKVLSFHLVRKIGRRLSDTRCHHKKSPERAFFVHQNIHRLK